MVPSDLKVLAKFGVCSRNCSQKLDECSLARARNIFASARMLGFALKIASKGGLSLTLMRGYLLACKQDLRKLQISFSVHPLILVKLSEVQQTAY